MSSQNFEQVFEAHAAFVWRCLGALGVRGADLDDLTQEVFVIVHRRLKDLDPAQGVRPWLYGILRNIVLNHRRSHRRRSSRHTPLDDKHPDPNVDQQATLEAREAAELITKVLQTMPEEQAEIFVLVDMEQMPVIDVGVALGIPVNTAHSRLRLARARFQAAFAQRNQS